MTAGVIWPSLLFPEDEPAADGPEITGGDAQSLSATPPAQPVAAPPASSGSQLADALAPAFPGKEQDIRTIGALLDQQPQDPDRLEQFHELVKSLVTSPNEAEEDNGGRPIADSAHRRGPDDDGRPGAEHWRRRPGH